MHTFLLFMSAIIFIGVFLQWSAWKFKIPSIILLLIAGLILGPSLGYFNPRETFGLLLDPFVEIAVAIIVFEGGLFLKVEQLKNISSTLMRIFFIGVPLQLYLTTKALNYFFGFPTQICLIISSALLITGPTVIMPLLRNANIKNPLADIIKWEAIINDPLGVILTLLILKNFTGGHANDSTFSIILSAFMLISFSLLLGFLWTFVVRWLFKRGHVPEYLKIPFILSGLFLTFSISDHFLSGSGILVSTFSGILLGNSNLPIVDSLKKFKESITILLVSILFITLASDLKLNTLITIAKGPGPLLLGSLILIRLISVNISMFNSKLSFKETLLLSLSAPRGIVSVSLASVVGTALASTQIDTGLSINGLMVFVIIGAILIYSIPFNFIAKKLELSTHKSEGILIAGASSWSISLAKCLKSHGIPVRIVDSRWQLLKEARMLGIETYYGDVIHAIDHELIDTGRFSLFLGATSNDAYNALLCANLSEKFGWENVYQLEIHVLEDEVGEKQLPRHLSGKQLGGEDASFEKLIDKINTGWQFSITNLTEVNSLNDTKEKMPESMPLLIIINESVDVIHRNDKKNYNEGKIVFFSPPSELS